ncbi:MAG TPA: ABC transporter permease [Chloroflexota bacterium]|jgi:macrolide transport system ATP-binding/permease protein
MTSETAHVRDAPAFGASPAGISDKARRNGSLRAVVDVKNLQKDYRTGRDVVVHALRNVSLQIMPGEIVAIMGPSGSGKSTFMNLIGCLDRPTSGGYLLDGVDVTCLRASQLADLRNHVLGFIFQGYNLLPRMDALENVMLPMLYGNVPADIRYERALAALQAVGLGDRAHHRPNEMSGGQQQRVAIARALVNAPRLILADEPTGNVDSRTSAEIMAILQQLNHAGATIVLVTHEPDIAAYCTRRVAFLDGQVVSDKPQAPARKATSASDWRDLPPPPCSGGGLRVLQAMPSALAALRANTARSVLTTLGIIIGVAAVIIIVSLGEGASASVTSQLQGLGTNLLIVMPGSAQSFGARAGAGSITTLRATDADAIAELQNVSAVSPVVAGNAQVIAGSQNWSTRVSAVSPAYPQLEDWRIASGAFFTDQDNASSSNVAVLGQTVATNLFPNGETPVGQLIRVRNAPFTVIGVLANKGSGLGGDQDDTVLIPFRTGQVRLFGATSISQIVVQVSDSTAMDQVQSSIEQLLRNRHRIQSGSVDDFNVRNNADIITRVSSVTGTLTLLLGGVAAVSLVVGGIGIMNIMLVSVTERTREIGIRLAIGAQRADILTQFIVEAVVLSALGGIIGIALGGGISLLLTVIAGWSTLLPWYAVVLAFGVSAAIGMFFGIYPARKASQLDPIDALRYE